MLRTIHLHGKAAKVFGKSFRLDVDTVPEAVRALSLQLPGFHEFVITHDWRIVIGGKVQTKGLQLEEDTLGILLCARDIHLTPAVQGSGGKAGIGKLIGGLLLAGFGFFAAPAMGIASVAGMSAKTIGMMGLAMSASGISQMMSAQPKSDDDDSDLFSGAPQMAGQGDVVPLIYGTGRVDNPPCVSAGIVNTQIDLGEDEDDDDEDTDAGNKDIDNTTYTVPREPHH